MPTKHLEDFPPPVIPFLSLSETLALYNAHWVPAFQDPSPLTPGVARAFVKHMARRWRITGVRSVMVRTTTKEYFFESDEGFHFAGKDFENVEGASENAAEAVRRAVRRGSCAETGEEFDGCCREHRLKKLMHHTVYE